MLNLDLVSLIVDSEEKLVGIGIAMQSMSRALQKSKGKLFPFGWIPLLKALKGKPNTNDRVDLMLVAVKPEYQGQGIGSKLIDFIFDRFEVDNITAETDDDAIGFYKKYGFTVADTKVKFDVKRYTCVKHKYI